MKALSFALILTLFAMQAMAAPSWTVYSDAVIVDGDEYENVSVYDTPPDHTTLDMSGGLVDSIGSTDQSTVNITGGMVYTLYAISSSKANISGGRVNFANSTDTSTLNIIDNADVGGLIIAESGIVNVFSGTSDYVTVSESGIANLRGGTLDYLEATGGTINVYGTSLSKTASGGHYNNGLVSGLWVDGLAFTVPMRLSSTYSHVILYEIPEPTIMVLLTFGAISLRRRNS